MITAVAQHLCSECPCTAYSGLWLVRSIGSWHCINLGCLVCSICRPPSARGMSRPSMPLTGPFADMFVFFLVLLWQLLLVAQLSSLNCDAVTHSRAALDVGFCMPILTN